MSRVAYVNGRYLPHRQAALSIDDRGSLFADAVYEVCEVRGGRLIDETRHVARLHRSLAAVGIPPPMSDAALGAVFRETVRRNRVRDGLVYLQVSRGIAPRAHLPPEGGLAPSVVVTAKPIDPVKGEARAAQGIAVATLADERWKRVDIKSTGLLPNILAKQRAKAAGAYEAWFVDANGFVTEGASTNAWIVTGEGVLVTRQADYAILKGITRDVVHELAGREGLALEERPFTVAEARGAAEAFITSASGLVIPVIVIDGQPIGDGRPGPIALMLRRLFHSQAEVASIWSRGGKDTESAT